MIQKLSISGYPVSDIPYQISRISKKVVDRVKVRVYNI